VGEDLIIFEQTFCTKVEVTRGWKILHNEDRVYHGTAYLSNNTGFNRLSGPEHNIYSLQKEA
jgi:hypothetical protein